MPLFAKAVLLSLALGLSVSLCAADFSKEQVLGQYWSLVDVHRIETYRFGTNGIVLAQVGIKHVSVAGPAYHWTIENGRLLILEGKQVKERFELLEQKGDALCVRRLSGAIVVFQSKAVKKAR